MAWQSTFNKAAKYSNLVQCLADFIVDTSYLIGWLDALHNFSLQKVFWLGKTASYHNFRWLVRYRLVFYEDMKTSILIRVYKKLMKVIHGYLKDKFHPQNPSSNSIILVNKIFYIHLYNSYLNN